jgi:hypothetical protein
MNDSCCMLWSQTQTYSLVEQFEMGVRFFDIRYKMDGENYYSSHTYPTQYTIQDAMMELVQCSQQSKEYTYIRLKRDSSSDPLPEFGTMFQSIHVNHQLIEDYIVRHPLPFPIGEVLHVDADPSPFPIPTIILFCDNDTLRDDHIPDNWYGPMLFDAIETWNCQSIMEASDLIHARSFTYNGLPKAIFLDYSSIYPPHYTSTLLWNEVKKDIEHMIVKKEIQCVMLNYITPDMIRELQHCTLDK